MSERDYSFHTQLPVAKVPRRIFERVEDISFLLTLMFRLVHPSERYLFLNEAANRFTRLLEDSGVYCVVDPSGRVPMVRFYRKSDSHEVTIEPKEPLVDIDPRLCDPGYR